MSALHPATPPDVTSDRRSRASAASWVAIGLLAGSAGVLAALQFAATLSPFQVTQQGVWTGLAPRALLCSAWAGAALAVIVGGASLCLVRRTDIASQAAPGILVRSLFAIVAGVCGFVVLWLIAGHVVIGF